MQVELLKRTNDVPFSGSDLFEKRTVLELTENEMVEIDGGTDPIVFTAILVAGAAGYGVGQWIRGQW